MATFQASAAFVKQVDYFGHMNDPKALCETLKHVVGLQVEKKDLIGAVKWAKKRVTISQKGDASLQVRIDLVFLCLDF